MDLSRTHVDYVPLTELADYAEVRRLLDRAVELNYVRMPYHGHYSALFTEIRH